MRGTRRKADNSPVTARRRGRAGGDPATGLRGCCPAFRWSRRKRRRTGEAARRRTNSCWSIRSTAPREFLAGRANTRSISRWCATACRSSAWSRRRRWAALARRGRLRRRAAALSPAGAAARRPRAIRTRAVARGERVAAVSRSHFDAGERGFLERFAPVTTGRLRFGAEVLPPRRGRGRPLSAACADLRMGCGGRPCAGGRGGRRGHGAGRRRASLRRRERRISRAGLHRLGRSRGRAAVLG